MGHDDDDMDDDEVQVTVIPLSGSMDFASFTGNMQRAVTAPKEAVEPQACFIGCDDRALAVIKAAAGTLWPGGGIWVVAPEDKRHPHLAEGGYNVVDTIAQLPKVPVVFLSNQPSTLQDSCTALRDGQALAGDPLIFSMAKGVSVDSLRQWTGSDRLVRLMLTPAMPMGPSSIFGFAAVAGQTHADLERFQKMFGTCGSFCWVPEERLLDLAPAMSGVGQAFYIVLFESMIAFGRQAGLPADLATELAFKNLAVASMQIMARDSKPADLIAQEMAQGGLTAQMIEGLEHAGVTEQLDKTITAACERAAAYGSGPLTDNYGT